MYKKAVPLVESIEGFIRDEFMIAVGDRAKIMFKVWLLAGSTLKIKKLIKTGASHESKYLVHPGHIAQGDRNYTPKIFSNRIVTLHSLHTHGMRHIVEY